MFLFLVTVLNKDVYYISLQEDESSFLFQETILQDICLVSASLLLTITLLISGDFIIIQAC